MFVSLVLLLAAAQKKKKAKNALEGVTLVVGTKQNFSNLYSLDIYDMAHGLLATFPDYRFNKLECYEIILFLFFYLMGF